MASGLVNKTMNWQNFGFGPGGYFKVTREGNHPGIILPRELAGAIILATPWELEVDLAETIEFMKLYVFSFCSIPIILNTRMIILAGLSKSVSL